MLRWIFEAIKFGEKRENTIRLLKENFTDIHQLIDPSGCSLLHAATNHRNIDAVEFIFAHYEERSKTEPSTFNYERKRELINKRDQRGFTALHYSVFRQQLPMVQLLERQGADIYLCSGDGLNCLHLAAQGGSPLLMHYFLGKGMKIGSTDASGSTPLHWACYSAAEGAVSALIAWKAELDCQENLHGATPLHLAVLSGSTRIVKWLLIAGCDRTIQNKKGQTPYDLAVQKKEDEIAEIIADRFSLLSLFNFRPLYRPTSKKGFPFFSFIGLFLVSLLTNIVYLIPPSSEFGDVLTIINFILGGLLACFLVLLSSSNPGVLKARENVSLIQLMRKGQFTRICYQCNIIKPVRSRHCTICGVCVSVYDHHCPWVGNCIGSKNYFRFFLFLVLLAFYLLYNLVYHIDNIFGFHNGAIEPVLALKITASVFNLALALVFAVPVIFLVVINARNAAENRTTFENLTHSSSSRFKSKALTVESQLTDKISLNSKKTKDSENLEVEEDQQEGDVLANCSAMCFNNYRKEEYHLTQ